MKAAFLPDRGVVKVSGEDARNFLNGLVTTDVTLVRAGPRPVRRAADAAGQDHRRFPDHRGARRPWRRLPDRLPARAGAGARRQARLLQAARQGHGRKPLGQPRRAGGVGRRARHEARSRLRRSAQRRRSAGASSCPKSSQQKVADLIGADLVDSAAYEAHRIATRRAARRPRLHVWRRVSARDQHGPAARRRFRQGLLCRPGSGVADAASRHRAHPHGAGHARGCSPEAGAPILAGDKPVGTMGSTAGGNGLALIRTDRVADALDAGIPLTAGGLRDPSRRAGRRARSARSRPSHEPIRAPACRRPDALPVAGRRPVLCRLSRHRMGRAGI